MFNVLNRWGNFGTTQGFYFNEITVSTNWVVNMLTRTECERTFNPTQLIHVVSG